MDDPCGSSRGTHSYPSPTAARSHCTQQVTAAFCRWLALPEAAVEFFINGQPLAGSSTADQAGIANGNAISARLRPGTPVPEQGFPQQFTMLDVIDSELGALADALAVAR